MGDPETGEATICFFGDGATSQGDVHEGFVWAAAYDAPLVFFCQNNQWAISVPLERQTRVPLYQRARGYGFPGIRVDGNDVLACLAVTRWALEECRTGNGPVLVEAFTYRMDAHTTSDDPTRYRLADELELWKLKDPIERVRVHLVREHGVEQDFFDEVARRGRRARRPVARVLPGDARPGARSGSSPRSTRSRRRRSRRSATSTSPTTRRSPTPGRRPEMTTLTMAKALNDGLRAAMERDPKVLDHGRGRRQARRRLPDHRRAAEGLRRAAGAGHPAVRVRDHRHRDRPGVRGFRPVCEIQFDGFVFPGYDQIVSQLAKLRYRSQGRVPMPVVVRIPFGGGIGAVEHHSESPESLFAHVAGLKVVACSNPADALPDDPAGDPQRRPGDLLRAQAPLLGEGRGRHRADPRRGAAALAGVVRPGSDAHGRDYGPMVRTCLDAATAADADGHDLEVIDLRTLSPLDLAPVFDSVRRTGRLVVVSEAPR